MRSIRAQLLFCSLALASAALTAQEPAAPATAPGPRAVYAATPAELRAWDTTIDQMVRARQLVVLYSQADPTIEGRRHETLAQYFQGIPVFGGSLSRQTARGATVSIIGTLFEGIAADSLAPKQVGKLMFPIAQKYVEKVVLVEDDAILASQKALWSDLRVTAEAGGAAAYAALLSKKYLPTKAERVGILVCGGNTTAVNFEK